ncbi:hypothetical protein Ciccas_002913 [Cichlidogyrus casuarinus]|uniref:Uncharacterized protein n=1 Tax=Cichlidogyrus casuarinus TaxID=1844966 RepID=A0ABD2QFW0_9PLAT
MWKVLLLTLLPALAHANCQIINLANKRGLAKCRGNPTDFDWEQISIQRTQRVEFSNLDIDLLQLPATVAKLNIEDIRISKSKIKAIDPNFFSASSNGMSYIGLNQVELPEPLTRQHFNGLQDSLTQLILHNSVILEPDALEGMKKLVKLSIKDSPMTKYPTNLGQLLQQGIEKVEFVNTRIQTFPWASIVTWLNQDVAGSKGVIDLTDSPLHCDETLKEMHTFIHNKENSKARLEGFKCASPEIFRDRYLNQISSEELAKVTEPVPKMEDIPYDQFESKPNDGKREDTGPAEVKDTVNKGSMSLITLAIFGGVLLFAIILIIAVIMIKRSRSNKYKGHT